MNRLIKNGDVLLLSLLLLLLLLLFLLLLLLFEPRHEISNNSACATSKGSD